MPTNQNGPTTPMVIVQAENEVVVHHDDLDLLISIARKGEDMAGNRTGAIVTQLSGPLDSMIVAEFDDGETARKFILIATDAAMNAGTCIKLDPRGYDGEDAAAAVRSLLLKSYVQ